MNTRGAVRLWLVGGTLAIVALIAATYLLAVKPVYDETASTRQQALDQEDELRRLNKQLTDLKKKSTERDVFTNELNKVRKNLPNNYDLANYLRQLQTSDSGVKVKSNSVSVAEPVAVPGAAGVVAVPITLSALGSVDSLSRFVGRLQNTQERAVLVSSVTLLASGGDPQLNVVLAAFCAKNKESDCTAVSA